MQGLLISDAEGTFVASANGRAMKKAVERVRTLEDEQTV